MGRLGALLRLLGTLAVLQAGIFAQPVSIVSGDMATFTVGQPSTTQLVVTVCQPGQVDCAGLQGTTILFQVQTSGSWASFCNSNFTSCTEGSGTVSIPARGSQASAYIMAGTEAGSYTITATDTSSNNSVTFHETNAAGAPAVLKACCGQNFQVVEGQPFPTMTFETTDGYGNLATPPMTITYTAPSTEPSANFGGTRSTTNATSNGYGSVPNFAADNSLGTYKLHLTGDCPFTTCTLDLTITNVQPAGTKAAQTALMSSLNPSIIGQPVNFTATVTSNSGTPTGTIAFMDGSTTIVSGVVLAGGMATYQDASLAAGTHSITAVYSGDSTYAASTSSPLSETVFSSPAATTTTVVSSANPSVAGQSVTFTATITTSGGFVPGNDGFLTFWDGNNELGTVVVNNGKGSVSLSSLSTGAHSITANYGGDIAFASSTSAVLTQTVNTASLKSTQTMLNSSLNPSVAGQPVNLTATVTSSSGTPTGTVTFKDGSSTIVSVALNGGTATYQDPSMAAGTHSLTAVYSGDSNYSGSTSATLTETVYSSPAATSTTLVSSADPSSPGQSVTFTAMVSTSGPGTPTGIVTWWDGITELGSYALNGNSASLTTSSLSLGAHSITANYGGDVVFAASTSAILTQTVSNVTTTTTALASSLNPAAAGQAVTFTAMVTPNGSGTPTGSVTFKDGSATLGSSNLSSGKASYTTSTLSAGTHSITAAYVGDSNFSGSTSGVLTQTVTSGSSTGLTVAPSGLTFTAYQGRSNPPTQSLQVQSSSPAGFTIANIPGWLSVSPTSGTTPATISVGVNASLLSSGATSASISIMPSNGQSVSVTIQASLDPFSIGASSPVSVSLAAGAATNGTLAVTTADNAPAAVEAAASTSTGGNWLTLASATLSAPGPLNYTVDATSLSAGNYTGTITLSCTSANPCAPVPVTVNLAVTPGTVAISQVLNATGEAPLISQNTWIEIKGTNLSQTKRIWQASDFDPATGLMPTELDGVSATVDGKPAYVYYISPTQVNVLTPLDSALGPVNVVVKNGIGTSAAATVTMLPNSLGFFAFNSATYAAATHANGALVGPATLYPGQTTPAAPGETIVLYGNGFGEVTPAINPGAAAQAGVLPYNPTITIGGLPATVIYAAVVTPGLYQFNVVVPPNAQNGDLALLATYNGVSTQPGVVVTVNH